MKRVTTTALLGAALLCGLARADTMAPERNNRYALIIGISHYTMPGIPTLDGVGHDMESARRMAKAMAIPDANIVYVRDTEATAQSLREKIRALDARVQPGDRIFVYYSGHGTRWFDPSLGPNGSCSEGLVASDGKVLSNREIGQLLKPLAQKTDKMMVFYDACFSGGIAQTPFVTRSLNLDNSRLTPKFTAVEKGNELCRQPSNFKTRALNSAMQQQGALPENIVHIAASRPDEVSFDNPSAGGTATVAWRDCLLGEARPGPTGSVTVEDVTVCAQRKLDAKFANLPNISGQHMTVGGNRNFVPGWIKASFVTPAPAPATNAAAPEPAAEEKPATPAEILARVHDQRDGARAVQVHVDKSKLKIGRDRLNFTVTSKRDGYLYVALAGSDKQSLYLLYPNALDQNNAIHANQPVTLPRQAWEVAAAGPAGTDTVLVMVTDSPRRLDGLKAVKDGPFMKTLLDAAGRSQLQQVLSTSANDDDAQCQLTGAKRNLNVVKHCSDAFGASLLTVEEVR
jgi:hypothetical protein